MIGPGEHASGPLSRRRLAATECRADESGSWGREPIVRERAISGTRRNRRTGRRDPEVLADYRRFWAEVMARTRFDDPTQPGPVRRGAGWIRADLSVPDASITAYTWGHNEVGVYRSTRGRSGAVICRELVLRRNSIDKELRDDAEWRNLGEAHGGWLIVHRRPVDRRDAESREKTIAWLASTLNDFARVFRPRVVGMTRP
jgi:hypothetical protein